MKAAWIVTAGVFAVSLEAAPAKACTLGGCPDQWPSDCYNLKSTKWCPKDGVSSVTMINHGSYEAAFDWARAEISDPKNGISNSLVISQVASGGQIKVYDYTGSADWWGLADQYATSNGTCLTSARIQINKNYMNSTVRKDYTILHEIGHTVGLNHVCVCPRTMNPCGTCGDDGTSSTPYLKSCDAKGIAAKYPGDDLGITPVDPYPADEALYQAHLLDAATHSDVNGDGKADACARDAAGVHCYLSSGGAFSVEIDGPALSDQSGWSDSDNASTLRLLDMNGDGLADLCARANAGIRCWTSTGKGFSASLVGPELSDAQSWDDPMYFTTLRAADFNGDGKDDLCVRAAKQFVCYPSTGSGFGSAVVGPALSNDAGWSKIDRYATIQMGDLDGDGKADVCARDASGMRCFISDGKGFAKEIAGPAWSDASNWNQAKYYSTIRLADVDGDGRADLCARSSTDFRCHLSTGQGFGSAIVGPAWSDASGWNQYDNYSTIRLADLDGDGDRDVCARANAGIVCAHWEGSAFGTTVAGPPLSDTEGFNKPEYFRTIRFADVDGDGRADLCARRSTGFRCYFSNGSSFPKFIEGPEWSDAAGFGDPKYYATIRIAGGSKPAASSGGAGGATGVGGAGGNGGGWAGTTATLGGSGGSGGNAIIKPKASTSGDDGGCSLAGRSSASLWLSILIALGLARRFSTRVRESRGARVP